MGKALYIRKIKEENGMHYYQVADDQKDRTRFCISINAQKKLASYFLNPEFGEPITVIDFNQTNSIMPIFPWDKGLASSAFFLAGIQAYRAIRDNHFPYDIGRYT